MKGERSTLKRVAFALLILLLMFFLFRLGSYILLPSEPVALVAGLRFSAGPLGAVLRLGLPKEIDSRLSQWRAVYFEFYTELDGAPAEVDLGFADGLWLTELWVRAEAEDADQAEALFHVWSEKLENTYQNAQGYQSYGITETDDGKVLNLEINKGALALSCVLRLESSTVSFYGVNIW